MKVVTVWLMIHMLAVYAVVRYRVSWYEAVAGSAMWLLLRMMYKQYEEVKMDGC